MAVEVDKEEKSSVKRPVAEEDNPASSSCGGNGKRGLSGKGAKGNANASTNNNYDEEEMNVEPELRTLNKTKHNWRSNKQYALTKVAAHKDKASLVVCHWLFKRYNFQRTTARHEKRFFTMSKSFVLLFLKMVFFSLTTQVQRHSCFSEKK